MLKMSWDWVILQIYGSSNFFVALYQPNDIIPLMAMSTGITSAWLSASTIIDLRTPFPEATNTPTGPFKESTQPGVGSFRDGMTMEGLAITNGMLYLMHKS